MIIADIFEANKTAHATFCFGRMNPPTIGHAEVFKTLTSVGGDYFIFVSPSQDKKENPLSYDEKINFIKAIHPQYADKIVENSSLNTVLKAASYLYEQGYKHITFVAGSDRLSQFETLLRQYNGVEGKTHGYYNFETLNFKSSGDRDPDSPGVSGISASKARAAAANNDFEGFQDATGTGEYARAMFDAVQRGMGVINEDAAGVGVIAKNKKMAKDPRYMMSLTQDVRPDTMNKNMRALRLKEATQSRQVLVRFREGFNRFVPDELKKKIIALLHNEPNIDPAPEHDFSVYAYQSKNSIFPENKAFYIPKLLFIDLQDNRYVAPYLETVSTTGTTFREEIESFNPDDPMDSRVAPSGGVGTMPLRDWKKLLAKKIKALNDEISLITKNAGSTEIIDNRMIWDRVKELLDPVNGLSISALAQEIVSAHNELEQIRRRGGKKSKNF